MSRINAHVEAPASVFAALGNVTRLDLIARLGDGDEHSITALSADLDLTRQAVTKHLQVLQHAGVVDRRRIGRESRFTMRPNSISEARDYLAQVSRQWDSAIERLRASVEEIS